MRTAQPVVVHPDEQIAGPSLHGMEMRHHRDPDGRWIGWSGWITNAAGDVSGWHHHAANATYVYVIRGSITVEFGPGGTSRIEASAGDFFIVPEHTVHRETTAADGDLEAFVFRIGSEREYVDVDGPTANTKLVDRLLRGGLGAPTPIGRRASRRSCTGGVRERLRSAGGDHRRTSRRA